MKKKLIFLDTETTGVDDTDRICQVAFKRSDEKASYESLFKPPVPISVDAMSITHITNEMVEDKDSFHESNLFTTLLSSFTKGYVLIAHNADFDMKFLRREGLTLPTEHICTMKIAHYHDKEGKLEKHNLQFLRYYFGLKFKDPINPHDAMSDVIVLEALFAYYVEHYTVEKMIEISSRPILLKKMPFGKHKGEWFKDMIVKDRDYMEWMWRSMEMDESMKYTVGYYLKGHHRTNQF